MSISSVSGSNLFSLADLGGITGIDQTSATVGFSDFPPPPPRHGGSFMDAIKEVLAALDADTSVATSSTVTTTSSDDVTSTKNVDAALNSFLQNLLIALHSESAPNSSTDSSTDTGSTTSASAVAAATASSAAAANRPPPPPPADGRLEADLTKLVQSLSASESSTSSTDTATSTSDSSSSGSAATNTDLESSFANLLSALGDSGGTSLSSFLQSITTKLHATPSSGNIINTTA
ncbi:hypothetical protein hmeg3_10050 [Herbaspirillum sp. meg3]|jgi:hypothetical protein|uniref:hypothetical protein n=1 Tax=Herbaspirillum sp. meg3 TaxID=2025949 RepID=UPI000B986817|nr:hypothetical protein [Herbaspirillum sp. meg3]ASU38604.1 hypothetical protein hmeg3_10050 [Herbaspirillum sp. meg3]